MLADEFEKASVRAAAGGGGGRAAGGRKSGGGGGGRPGDGGKQREKQISMALSRLLRHQALNAGIKLDKEGYAPLDRVVSSCLLFSFYVSSRLAVCFPLRSLGRSRPLVSAYLLQHIPDITATGSLSALVFVYLPTHLRALFPPLRTP